ncbi:MAG: hypothetical protein J5871_01640 [Bacteroidales bacterium]|nr:hypothetical protein [Bacteroidales bacterium]
MIRIVSTNITSPLGLTTGENYAAVARGERALQTMDGCLGVPGSFCVGIFPESRRKALRLAGFSWFESLVLRSVREVLSHTVVNPASPRTVFIVGTSTAGVEELGAVPEKDGHYLAPGVAAQKVADALGFAAPALLVSNACISGATAQMLACRLLESGVYDSAVVCGADVLSAFVLAGFQALKALSPVPCRPFDMERLGLNIGECAATVVLTRTADAAGEGWYIVDGCLNNDAWHVSAPIPSGDGVYRAVRNILTPARKASLACVTAHGTATMFNDQMESKAIEQAGLGDIPVTAYKAHFGHTFGASGIVEAIITMCSLDEGVILPAAGFSELGVSGKITLCSARTRTDRTAFIKTQSGFGSCNGAMLYAKHPQASCPPSGPDYAVARRISVTPGSAVLDGRDLPLESSGAALVSELYKKYLSDGSRFFKMDLFSRLAYAAAGLLARNALDGIAPEEVALLFFTQNGSVLADRKHLSTFCEPDAFYPSPAVFINTLPNVVLGELAVTCQVKGETTLVMLPEKDGETMETVIRVTLDATRPKALLCGWVDCTDENTFGAELELRTVK